MRTKACVLLLLLAFPVAYGTKTYARRPASHATVQRDSHGRIKRSESAKNAFKHEHPCPSTGRSTGGCPNFVVDHINPLECGGPDSPQNMQWQSVADAKAKDRLERFCR
jgi:5-methylcytosine-specific restriction endonuclease McrA